MAYLYRALCILVLAFFLAGCSDTIVKDPSGKKDDLVENNETSLDEEEIIIQFSSDYGEVPKAITIKTGEKVEKPRDPVSDFYDFLYWQKAEEDGPFDFTLDLEEDTSLTAIWEKNDSYQARFFTSPSDLYEEFLFTKNSTIPLPTNPSIEGQVFLGWFRDENLSLPFDENEVVASEDITLYASFIALDEYMLEVRFNNTGESIYDNVYVLPGNTLKEVPVPKKKGYTFLGWYQEQEEMPYDFSQEVEEDLSLYAKWEFDDDFSIVHLISEGEETKTIILAVQESYLLQDRFKEGYMFEGWYSNQNYSRLYPDTLYFGQALDEELYLYAKWTSADKLVYIEVETSNGSPVRYRKGTGTLRSGRIIQGNALDSVSIFDPSKEGYTFSGWYYDQEYTEPLMPLSYSGSTRSIQIPEENTTIYAKWISTTTGQVEDPSPLEGSTIMDNVEAFGFDCEGDICTLEEYSDRNYIFDLSTNTLSYIISVEDRNASGYRLYDRLIRIEDNYDIYYSYDVEEDYGYLYRISLIVEGNYQRNDFSVTHFESNVTDLTNNYEKALDFIDNLFDLYEAITRPTE